MQTALPLTAVPRAAGRGTYNNFHSPHTRHEHKTQDNHCSSIRRSSRREIHQLSFDVVALTLTLSATQKYDGYHRSATVKTQIKMSNI